MVGWHHWLNGHEFEQALGDGEGQGSLACCSPWGRKESDTTEQLNNNRLRSPYTFPHPSCKSPNILTFQDNFNHLKIVQSSSIPVSVNIHQFHCRSINVFDYRILLQTTLQRYVITGICTVLSFSKNKTKLKVSKIWPQRFWIQNCRPVFIQI